MVLLTISDIEIDFPFTPYPAQIEYMEKVILSLQTKNNAILESPTGTGKTLCLLCATLSWQKVQKKVNGKDENGKKVKVPVILYASRTHSQLKQVISELKNTTIRPKMTTLASREHLCVHTTVSKLKGRNQGAKCNSLGRG